MRKPKRPSNKKPTPAANSSSREQKPNQIPKQDPLTQGATLPRLSNSLKKRSKEYRIKLAWWTLNTIAAAFIGFWLADAISCLEKAENKVETASQNMGFLP